MKRAITVVLLTALATIASCSPATDDANRPGNAATDASSEPAMTANEQDLVAARVALEAATERWNDAAVDVYTLTVELQTVSAVRVEVVDGVVLNEEIVQPGSGIDALPRTVDAAFEAVDALLTHAEANPHEIAAPGECGYHFNVRFSPTLGHPEHYDTLGPCDDGVGVILSVTPTP